jgi:hypothetical protein
MRQIIVTLASAIMLSCGGVDAVCYSASPDGGAQPMSCPGERAPAPDASCLADCPVYYADGGYDGYFTCDCAHPYLDRTSVGLTGPTPSCDSADQLAAIFGSADAAVQLGFVTRCFPIQ